MNSPGLGCDLADTARRLAAAAGGTSAQLRRELSRAQIEIDGMSSCRRQTPAGDDERVELLGAVVQAMRRRVARSSRQDPSCLEGTEVHVQLLQHLARLVTSNRKKPLHPSLRQSRIRLPASTTPSRGPCD